MYQVGDVCFETFEDVVRWAWNTHKIDANFIDVMDEADKIQACEELHNMIMKEEEK